MRLSAHLSLALVGLAALTAPALQAAGPTFGLQAGLALPSGDLKDTFDSVARINLGLHMNVDLGQGHVLRPRLERTAFGKSETTTNLVGSRRDERRAALTTFGADYLYHLEGQTSRGLYALAGAGLCSSKLTREVHITSILGTADEAHTFNSTKPYFCFGAGYQFNKHWGTEVRMNFAKHHTSATATLPEVSGNLNTLNVMATFRF